MSSSNFKFDENALRKVGDKAMRQEVIPEWQRAFDSAYRTHRGKPVEDMKRELRRQLGKVSKENEAAVDACAQAISDGKRIAARPGPA